MHRIGRYEIKGRIGGGGMGTLYLARDTNPTTDRLVAIKLLRTSFDSDELRERFAREAQALAELNHPNIVTIHDSGEFQDSPFIVMEYVRGETLAESIKRRAPISLAQKLRLLAELCDGLAHAHEAGIVHRDIKPANLMVELHGRLKILDFGIARVVDSGLTRVEALTRLNVRIGTPGYMSPEQIEGREIDARSDLFSVGSVAYELISYREAFPGATTRQIEDKVLSEQPIPLPSSIPGLDPEIVEIIASALEKDVERRCQHAETLARAFERVRARLEEEERMPRPTPAPRPGVEHKSRHERAAQMAYERAMASFRDGAEGFARRSAMEALAEYPQHAEARQLLAALGHIRDVEPWLPPPVEGARAATVGLPTDGLERTIVAQPGVQQPPDLWRQSPAPSAAPATESWRESPPPAPTAPPVPAPAVEALQELAGLEKTLVPPSVEQPMGPERTPVPPPVVKRPVAQPRVPPASRPPRPAKSPSPRRPLTLTIVIAVLVLMAIGGALAVRLIWGVPAAGEQLTITKPDGGTILGDGIQCGTRGSNCSVSHPRGTAVTLQAQADAGFVFNAFTGDCASTGGTVMDAARTCGARFSPLTPSPPSGQAEQPAPTPVPPSLTPSEQPAAAPPPATVTEFELRIAKPLGGTIFGRSIRCGAAGDQCVARYPTGFAVALRQQPEPGYTFGAFTGDCSPSGRTVMAAVRNCSAKYVETAPPPPQPAPAPPSPPAAVAPPSQPPAAAPVLTTRPATFVLTIDRPVNGTITGDSVDCGPLTSQCMVGRPRGMQVQLRARPNPGYKLAAFTGDCDRTGMVVMNAARTCGATFVKEGATAVHYILTIRRPRDGTILGDGMDCGPSTTQCSAVIAAGTTVQLRAQPNPGFMLIGFTDDCSPAGATVMTTARTCGATFGPAPPGSPSAAKITSKEIVAGPTVHITAPAGWQQVRWQLSTDGGRSWNDLTDNEDYAGVATRTLTVRHPTVEMNGYEYRARQTVGPSPVTSAPMKLIVKPGV